MLYFDLIGIGDFSGQPQLINKDPTVNHYILYMHAYQNFQDTFLHNSIFFKCTKYF